MENFASTIVSSGVAVSEPAPKPSVTVTFEVSHKTIVNFVERANIVYWAEITYWDPETLVLSLTEHGGIDDNETKHTILHHSDWARGIAAMITQAPRAFTELTTDDGDMYTGDLLIQCTLFGEEKYC